MSGWAVHEKHSGLPAAGADWSLTKRQAQAEARRLNGDADTRQTAEGERLAEGGARENVVTHQGQQVEYVAVQQDG
jgi:hypothetical protein